MTAPVSKRINLYERHKTMGFVVTCSSAHKDFLNMRVRLLARTCLRMRDTLPAVVSTATAADITMVSVQDNVQRDMGLPVRKAIVTVVVFGVCSWAYQNDDLECLAQESKVERIQNSHFV
jgi:hypothetical protein